jgi:hypothetical protein
MPEDLKSEMFGRVNVRRTGKHAVNPKHLHAPFEGPEVGGLCSVAYCFCRGCGLLAELTDPQAHRLAAEAGTSFEGAWPSEFYFETNGCPFCAFGENAEVTIMPLPPFEGSK